MALYEFHCPHCKNSFEQITRQGDADYGRCPHCGQVGGEKLISGFALKGRGDQRESTWHGCHGPCSHNHSKKKPNPTSPE